LAIHSRIQVTIYR